MFFLNSSMKFVFCIVFIILRWKLLLFFFFHDLQTKFLGFFSRSSDEIYIFQQPSNKFRIFLAFLKWNSQFFCKLFTKLIFFDDYLWIFTIFLWGERVRIFRFITDFFLFFNFWNWITYIFGKFRTKSPLNWLMNANFVSVLQKKRKFRQWS